MAANAAAKMLLYQHWDAYQGRRVYGTDGYQVMTMRTMKRMVLSERKGPSTLAMERAVSGSRSLAAVSNNACAATAAFCTAGGRFWVGGGLRKKPMFSKYPHQ